MQKIKKAFISLIIVALIFNVLPFKLFADSQTYYEGGSTTEYFNFLTTQNTNPIFDFYFYTDPDVRAVGIKNTTTNSSYIVGVSLTRGYHLYYRQSNVNSWTTGNVSSSSYYLGNTNNQRFFTLTPQTFSNSNIASYHIPIFEYTGSTQDWSNYQDMAYYYTFGDGAVEPQPSLNYGELIVGFHTNFSASGTTNNYTITSNTNLDTIEWKNVDSNGNDLQNKGLNVQIRAVPILYSANSKSALDLLGFQDAVVNYNDGLILWTGNFNDNHKSFIWNDVINQLQTSNPAFAITSLLTGSVWTRYGWIYQIKYNDVLNDYSSEWQTIYNSTSITVSDSEKIVNQYYYNYPSGVGSDDQDIFHDINTVNNTNNTWYVNEVPVDPDSSWLDALIQAIAEILGKILDFFSSIFDGLVDLILGLFGDINPADSFFNWFSNLFNGIGDIDLTLPEFNLPNADLTSFNRLVQETLNIFSFNNFGFVIFIPLLLLIIKAVF